MNYSGGDKKREAKKNIMQNLLFNVKKNQVDKKVSYNVTFNKLTGKNASNQSLVTLQNVVKNILSSIDSNFDFSDFFSLEEYLKKNETCSYNTIVKFVNSIDSQIEMLKSYNKAVLSLSIKNIWIVNNKYFIFMGNSFVKDYGLIHFNNKKMFSIDTLSQNELKKELKTKFKKNYYIAPELLSKMSGGFKKGDVAEGDEAEGDEAEGDVEGDEAEGDEVEGDEAEGDEAEGDEAEGDEAEGDGMEGDEVESDGIDDGMEGLHVNVTNFSLGKIILVMLFGKKMEKNLSYDKMKEALNPIIYTKIYYYTLRCIDPNPEMRVNLYV